jgi:hypothetical protein
MKYIFQRSKKLVGLSDRTTLGAGLGAKTEPPNHPPR